MSASKLIDQGSYGCIYHPGIQCSGKPSKDKTYVSKLQELNSTSKNEIDIGRLVQEIPDFQDFFLPVLSFCATNLSLIDSTALEKCEIIRPKSSYVLLKISYFPNQNFFLYIVNPKKSKIEIFSNMVDSYQYLLKAIQLLMTKNIVHFDLKNDNVLFNVATQEPHILDFGLSLNMAGLTDKNIQSYFYIYAPDYYIWPIEVHIICYLVNKRLDSASIINKHELETIANLVVENNKGLNIYSPEFKERFLEKTIQYVSQFAGKTKASIIKTLLTQKNYQTWDNYALSILFLRCFEYIFYNGFTHSKLLIKLSQLLLQNIYPDPEQRFTVEKTQKRILQILNEKESMENLEGIVDSISVNTNIIDKDNLTRYE